MESNLNIPKNLESNVYFSAKLLNVVWYIGMIGSFMGILPYVFSHDNDFLL